MLRRSLLAAVAVIGVSATAQSTEIYKDYVPSKAVGNVTMVKVVPNRIDDYLGGLKQSWVSGCEINKKMGVLEDCSIFISETFASGAMMEPDEARYNNFMGEFRKGLEEAKQDELVQGYEEFRSYFGEMHLRRVEWK